MSNLDHLTLTVFRPIEKTVGFYTDLLGMDKEVFGAGRVALKLGKHKPNSYELGNELSQKRLTPLRSRRIDA